MVVKATASPILQLIRRSVEDVRVRELPDQDLLQQFHAQQDQAAFHALLRRHGPMVLDVCRGVVGNEADAEDAFQATFLILARKADSIRKTAALASWLHGVAYRTAHKARAQSAARQKHEARAPTRQPAEPEDLSWREVRQAVHEELDRLPERYRAPLVLCYLEGLTQEAAAVRLKLAKSTLRERLERGRALLRTRLVRRGLGPAAVLVTAAWPAVNASAYLPLSMVSSTVKAASLLAAGQPAAAALISAKAAALTEGVLKTMLLNKLKIAVVAVLVIGTLGMYISAQTRRTLAAEPPPAASKSVPHIQDDGNIKETVLALEKRIWEAHAKQDVNTFKNLLADDYVGLDIYGRRYTKQGALNYVAQYRIVEYTLKDSEVILLNASSAIVTYEVSFTERSADGKHLGGRTDHNSTAWALRDGKWWAVFTESKVVGKDRTFKNVLGFDVETGQERTIKIEPVDLSETLRKLNPEYLFSGSVHCLYTIPHVLGS
jgi:RNA polymerase sigma factor (sigma-70 family)